MTDKELKKAFGKETLDYILRQYYDVANNIGHCDERDPYHINEELQKRRDNLQSWVEVYREEIKRRFRELEEQLHDVEE